MNMREIWIELQRAGVLVFRAASAFDGEAISAAFDEFVVAGEVREILIRLGCGYSPSRLRPEVYASRYPYSDVAAIRALLLQLVDAGLAEEGSHSSFSLTQKGIGEIQAWYERMALALSGPDLAGITRSEIEELIEADREIVAFLDSNRGYHGSPVLDHRLKAVLPDFSRPALWHHHFHTWTIQAAQEDEGEHVRIARDVDWIEWFVRRQLWFIDRRPWLARARTFERLAHYLESYAPIEDAEAACREAFDRLATRGEAEAHAEGLRLTPQGLTTCDGDELEIDTNLLARWPEWSHEKLTRLHEILDRLNARFEQIRAPNTEPQGGPT